MEKKIHEFSQGGDFRSQGQSEYEYTHTTLCDRVGRLSNVYHKVNCVDCLRMRKKIESTGGNHG